MLDITDYLIIFCLGSLGGFTSGFLGVGGGIIYIPILDYFLRRMGLENETLVKGILANSLFTIIFSGSIASYKQFKSGNFFPKEILQTAFPGIFTALVVTWLIRNGSWYSKEVFNYVFSGMLLIIALRMFLAKPAVQVENHVAAPWQFGLTGFFAGIVTAFSGLGGGVVMTPVFTDVLKQNIRKASSVSNGVIPMFAIAVGIYNLSGQPTVKIHDWQIGYILFPLVLPLIAAAVVFAPLGVKLSHTVSQKWIRLIFAMFVAVVLVQKMYTMFIGTHG